MSEASNHNHNDNWIDYSVINTLDFLIVKTGILASITRLKKECHLDQNAAIVNVIAIIKGEKTKYNDMFTHWYDSLTDEHFEKVVSAWGHNANALVLDVVNRTWDINKN